MIHTPVENDEAHDAFERFAALLVTVAGALVANRSEATTYSQCRVTLLESGYRRAMPGFVVQCISVFRFREFIALYDPSAAVRQDFVRSALADCRTCHARLCDEPFAPRARSPQEWTL